MKKVSKIMLMGATVFGLAILGAPNQAYAADRITNIESSFDVQSHSNGNNRSIPVDHLFFKFNSDFKINQPVKDGDFFEVETHVFPQIGSGDIYAGGGDKTVIGEIKCPEVRRSARSAQGVFAGVSPEFQAIDPADGVLRKCTLIFNKNAEGRSEISIGFKNGSINVPNAIVNKDYDISAWVKVNGVEKYKQDFTVIGFKDKYKPTTNFYHYRTILNTNDGTFYTGPGFSAANNLTGHFLEMEISDDSLIVFSKDQQEKIPRGFSNFIYDDNSIINPRGVIKHSSTAGSWQPEFVSVEDKKYVMKVASQTGESITSGLPADIIRLKLTPEAIEYYKQHGELPKIKYTLKIRDAQGNIIKENKSEAPINIVGSRSNFKSFVQETPKVPDIEESKDDIPSKDKEEASSINDNQQQSGPLNIPNTGFVDQAQDAIFGILGLAIILAIGTYYTYKK